jgi:LysR family transcriptional regulator for bpeEF and oprC
MPGHPLDIDPRHCLGIFRRGSYTSSTWNFSLDDEQHVIQPQGSLHFNSTDALISAALADQGLVHVLDVFASGLIASGELVALLPQWQTSVRTFFAVTPGARYVAPRTRAFIDFILETLDSRRRPPVGTQVGLHK